MGTGGCTPEVKRPGPEAYHSTPTTAEVKKTWIYSSIGLWDVEGPTFSRKSFHRWRRGCQPYAPAGRPLHPGKFLAPVSLRGWFDTRITVRLEELSEKYNNLIRNQTCDLPACSVVPQRTTLQRAPKEAYSIAYSIVIFKSKCTLLKITTLTISKFFVILNTRSNRLRPHNVWTSVI
jgi:hypothetical protein